MIGKLTGTVDHIATDHILLDVRGVGYIVFCSAGTLRNLELGTSISLFTDMVVREDLMQLYGFLTPIEKEWHRILMSVQGVGAKAALAISGAIGVSDLQRAIALEDVNTIRKAPGVGPKLAARIVRELAGKVPEFIIENNTSTKTSSSVYQRDDALEALLGLGYESHQARRALAQQEQGDDVAAKIKGALKLLGQEA
jgi:Holliday junction DNA helicase RuvA